MGLDLGNTMFQSYAHQHLSLEDIQHYAKQYDGVDMWLLIGQDENFFPFLIGTAVDNYRVVYWSKRHGIISYYDDDPVRYYAFMLWLDDNIHPAFATLAAAERHAVDREWPRLD